MAFRIPIYEPWLGKEEADQLTDCVSRNWLTGGEKVKEFEHRVAELCEVGHAVACSNGTVALYMALWSLGICEGDEVVVPDFTFIASANAVAWTGARPVFCDVDPITMDMRVEDIENVLTSRTKAIMPVHIYGRSCEMDEICELAQDKHLLVIEDACQGVGVTYRAGLPVGGLGNAGCLSFYADKSISTGEGGMVLTDYGDVAKECLILKHQGRTGRGWYIHDRFGVNFRMTDMQAGVGLAQLGKLPKIIEAKKRHEELYRKELSSVPGIRTPEPDIVGRNVPFRHNIFVDDPESLMQSLADKGIESKRVFFPLHRQPCYRDTGQQEHFPNTDKAYGTGLSLPSSPLLTDQEIAEVCAVVKEWAKVQCVL